MQTSANIWINLNIENCSFVELAKYILPKCEFEVRSFERKVTGVILNLANGTMEYGNDIRPENIEK